MSDHLAEDPEQRRLKGAQWLHQTISNTLRENLKAEAAISKQIVLDVIIHWERDMDRISAAQHGEGSATKHIAHQAFWIRKLKPISRAYRTEDLNAARRAKQAIHFSQEIVDANERVAIALACKLLIVYVEDAIFFDVTVGSNVKAAPLPSAAERTKQFLREYFSQRIGGADGAIIDNLLYNMRYRTFGPHHMTQILDQAVFATIHFSGSS